MYDLPTVGIEKRGTYYRFRFVRRRVLFIFITLLSCPWSFFSNDGIRASLPALESEPFEYLAREQLWQQSSRRHGTHGADNVLITL